ncbi:hypothetical protein NDU88_008798 [Pleurodeles waltl]|uniref:Uncharacterized protein n=1 Tax=Pleurodeles waltl TaxID=8319 RepID=A0AAV7QPU5_PLEWA|nr:hypothetical protein NDU88_008798 [Pleurodeles waltl]
MPPSLSVQVKHTLQRNRRCFYTGRLEHDKKHLKTLMKQLSLLRLLKGGDVRVHHVHQIATKCWKALHPGTPQSSGKQSSRWEGCVYVDAELKENGITSCDQEHLGASKDSTTSLQDTSEALNKRTSHIQDSLVALNEITPPVHDSSWALNERSPLYQKSSRVLNEEPTTIVESLEVGSTRTPTNHGSSRTSNEVVSVHNVPCPSQESKAPDTHEKLLSQWFNSLPQRLVLPFPKVLCRPSRLRWVKPCCTRSCDDCLENNNIFQYHL